MPKRKAVSSPEEEETPPKTNRQKREEAKARAKEWAERGAGLKKKATTPTRRTTRGRVATPKTKPTRKKATPKKSSPIKSPEPAAKRQRLNSGKAAKKITRKQQRAEATARAQEWAEELDSKKKKSTPAKKSTSATKATPTKKATAKSPSPTKPSPAAASVDAASPYAVANGGAGVNGGLNAYANDQVNLMRAQQQQAMARAQMDNAWAMQFQQRMANLSSPQRQQMMMSPEQQRRYHDQVMRDAAMAAYSQPYIPAPAAPAQAYNYVPPSANVPVNVPMNIPVQSPQRNLRGTYQPPNVPPYLRSPPVNAPPVNAPAPMNAPPAAAAAKASSPAPARRRVAAKKKKATPVASPKESTPPEEADNAAVEQDDIEVEGSSSKGFRFLPHKLRVLLLPVVVAIGAYYAFLRTDNGSEALESVSQSEPVLPPCFISNPREEEQVFQNCDRSKGTLRCPDGGRCSRGQLKSCVQSYMVVSESGDQCVLSAGTNETLAKVEALLAEWTVEHTCTLKGCAHAVNNPDTRAPFFDIALVREKMNLNEALLSLSDSFVVLSGSGETIIGLTDDYLDTKLIVPLWCYFALLAFGAFELLVSVFMYIGTLVTGFALNITMAFPLATVAGCLLLWASYAIRNKRRLRAQLRQDVATARDLTYGKLIEDTTMEHFVIHLRDEVAMDLYPTSKTKRAYIINKVWPRVVADVKQDNRVLKSTKMWQGTPRDAWQWTASSTPGKK